jgi:hypothetical protein
MTFNPNNPCTERSHLMNPRGRLLVLALVLLTTTGCSTDPPTGVLRGEVSFDGQLLRSGSIEFVDAQGKVTATAISREGTYRVSKVPAGTIRVAVFSTTRVPEKMRPLTKDEEQPVVLPARYGKPADSNLVVEVHGGTQEFNIVMEP